DTLTSRVGANFPLIFSCATLFMLALGVLGWRWTFAWRRESRLLALAATCIPLPYVLTHAEGMIGPRLPLDGGLLTFAAHAWACMLPGVGPPIFRGPAPVEAEEPVRHRPREERPYVRL